MSAWWVINGEELLAALHRVADGDDPLLLAEHQWASDADADNPATEMLPHEVGALAASPPAHDTAAPEPGARTRDALAAVLTPCPECESDAPPQCTGCGAIRDDMLVSPVPTEKGIDAETSASIIASLRARLDAVSDLADHLVGNEAAPLIRENGYVPSAPGEIERDLVAALAPEVARIEAEARETALAPFAALLSAWEVDHDPLRPSRADVQSLRNALTFARSRP